MNMKKYLSELLISWAKRLYTEPLTKPEPKHIGLMPIKGPVVHSPGLSKGKCPNTLKMMMSEKDAKSHANTNKNPKLHPYECLFCEHWHVSKQKSRQNL